MSDDAEVNALVPAAPRNHSEAEAFYCAHLCRDNSAAADAYAIININSICDAWKAYGAPEAISASRMSIAQLVSDARRNMAHRNRWSFRAEQSNPGG